MTTKTDSRESLVPKYFLKTPERPAESSTSFDDAVKAIGTFFLVLGVLAFAGGGWSCLGLIFALGGIFAIFLGITGSSSTKKQYSEAIAKYEAEYERAEPKPTDQQMDSWLSSDVSRLKRDALQKLGLEGEQLMRKDPLVVVGPAKGTDVQLGKDKVFRFSKYDVVVVYLTDYHLAAYSCVLNLASGLALRESTQEYHYNDVVSVATQNIASPFTITLNGQEKSVDSYQQFVLAVASGDRIAVGVSFPQLDKLDDWVKTGTFAPSGAEEAIRVIRARLREKKGGTHT